MFILLSRLDVDAMSATTATQLVDRSMTDESFLARLRSEPDLVADEYGLDEAVTDALANGDENEATQVFRAEKDPIIVVVAVL